MTHNNKIILRPSNLTLDEVRNELSGLHFAKEALNPGERQILALAESLLYFIDNQSGERWDLTDEDAAVFDRVRDPNDSTGKPKYPPKAARRLDEV